jgi:hypothetical protein
VNEKTSGLESPEVCGRLAMEAPSSKPQPMAALPSPACKCHYWRSTAVDALLELAATRKRLAPIDEDLVALVASRMQTAYHLLGGMTSTAADRWRALARGLLAGGDDGVG